jgi:hypothetical protein
MIDDRPAAVFQLPIINRHIRPIGTSRSASPAHPALLDSAIPRSYRAQFTFFAEQQGVGHGRVEGWD